MGVRSPLFLFLMWSHLSKYTERRNYMLYVDNGMVILETGRLELYVYTCLTIIPIAGPDMPMLKLLLTPMSCQYGVSRLYGIFVSSFAPI